MKNLLAFAHRLRHLGELHLVRGGKIYTVTLERYLRPEEDHPHTLAVELRCKASVLVRR